MLRQSARDVFLKCEQLIKKSSADWCVCVFGEKIEMILC